MLNHLIWPSNHRHDRGWPSGVFHSCWTIVSPNLYVMKVFLFPITMVNHRGISLFPKGPFQAVDLLYFLIDRVWSISKGPHNKHHSQISQIELHYFPYRANLSSGMVRMWPASLCDPLFFSSWLYFQGILEKFATCALQAYEQIYFFFWAETSTFCYHCHEHLWTLRSLKRKCWFAQGLSNFVGFDVSILYTYWWRRLAIPYPVSLPLQLMYKSCTW